MGGGGRGVDTKVGDRRYVCAGEWVGRWRWWALGEGGWLNGPLVSDHVSSRDGLFWFPSEWRTVASSERARGREVIDRSMTYRGGRDNGCSRYIFFKDYSCLEHTPCSFSQTELKAGGQFTISTMHGNRRVDSKTDTKRNIQNRFSKTHSFSDQYS